MSNGIRPVLYNYIYLFTVCKFNLFAVVPIVGSTHSRDVHKGFRVRLHGYTFIFVCIFEYLMRFS